MKGTAAVVFGVITVFWSSAMPVGAQEDLDARVTALEALVKQLQAELRQMKGQEHRPETATSAKPPSSPGFNVNSDDGKSRLSLRGLIHVDSRTFLGGGGGPGSLVARRIRPILEGSLSGKATFNITPDFGDGRVVLQDAYVETPLGGGIAARVGKGKAPLSIERLQSSIDMPFPEKSIANGLQPNRDVGFQLMGKTDRDRLTIAAGVFNGVLDGASSDGDAGDHKDFGARVLLEPWKLAKGHPLQGLALGAAVGIGQREESLSGLAYRTAGRTTFFRFAQNATATGAQTRWSPHLLYYNGPFGLLGEAIRSEQSVALGNTRAALRNEGWVLSATWFLTGESNGYRNPIPRNAARGAWELAARFSGLSVDSRAFSSGLADPAVSASSAHALSLGVNWHMMRGVKWQMFYETTWLNRPVKLGPTTSDHEGVFFSRLQAGF